MLLVLAAGLISIGLLIVVYNLKQFWLAILGYIIFNEKINIVEILGMIICFGALITMTY